MGYARSNVCVYVQEEKRRQQEAQQKQQEDARKQQQAQEQQRVSQQQDLERQKQQALMNKRITPGSQEAITSREVMAPTTKEFVAKLSVKSAEFDTAIAGIMGDALKKQRRDVEKKMTIHVQQISGTLEQVCVCVCLCEGPKMGAGNVPARTSE